MAVGRSRIDALDTAGNRLLFTENVSMMSDADSIFAVDLATGARTTISDEVSVGTGAGFGVPLDLVLVPAVNATHAIVCNIGDGGAN